MFDDENPMKDEPKVAPVVFADGDWSVAQRVVAELPQLVREQRAASGVSIRRAAAGIGIAYTTLDRIERRQVDPRRQTVVAILNWLRSLPPVREHVTDGDCWCDPKVLDFA